MRSNASIDRAAIWRAIAGRAAVSAAEAQVTEWEDRHWRIAAVVPVSTAGAELAAPIALAAGISRAAAAGTGMFSAEGREVIAVRARGAAVLEARQACQEVEGSAAAAEGEGSAEVVAEAVGDKCFVLDWRRTTEDFL